MNHEQHVGEPGAKISSICVVMPGGLGCVDIHTFGAVQLHHGLSWDVWQACEKCGRGRNPFKYEIKTPETIGKQSLVDQSYPHLQENLDSIKTNSICFVLIGTASQIQLLCLLITDLKTNKQTKTNFPKTKYHTHEEFLTNFAASRRDMQGREEQTFSHSWKLSATLW